MKKVIYKLLLVILLFGCQEYSLAQSITITESINSNEPAPVYQGQTRVLYGCAWEYAIEVEVVVTGTCSTFTQTLPPGMQFNIVPSANVTINSNNGTQVSYTVTGTSGGITMEILNPCALPANYQANPMSYTGQVGCTVSASPVTYLIKTPEVAFDNFQTTFDGNAYGSATPIQLYKKNDNTLLIRNFDIKLNEGNLRHLDFEYTPDLELGTVTLQLSAGVNNLPVYTTNGPTTISLTSAEIGILFSGRQYLQVNDVIHVVETSFIDNCSNLPSLDNTIYRLKSICTDYCVTPNCNCKVNEMNKAISVSNSTNWPSITHFINGGYSNSYQIDVCGVIPFDFEFRITNPNFSVGNVANTAIKKMNKIFLPVDLNAFDIENAGIIDTDRILFRFNNTSHSVAWLINNNIVPANFFSYNAVTQQLTFDFANLTNGAILTAWNGNSPFFNWYNPNQYNDFKENTSFDIILDDLLYQYNKFQTLGNPRRSLDDCHPATYFALFTEEYYNDFFNFYRMCEVEPQTLTSDAYAEYMWFKNTYEVTGFAEASSPDVEIGQPVDVEFYFSGPSSGNPWNLVYPASGYNSINFNCTANTYRAEIVVPNDLLINPNTPLVYYPNPNNLNVSVNIPVPTATVNGAFLHYVVDLIDQNAQPVHTANGMIRANIQMAPCSSTTSGFADVQIRIQNICNANCPGFVNTVTCFGTQLFWRCTGPCCGPPQSTANFSFNRTTPGFTNNTLTTPVVLNPAQHKVNRSYPCDHIDVSSEGQIFRLGDTCTIDSTVYTVIQVDEFYFRIAYTSPVAFQFYDFENAFYTTTINGVTSGPINIPLSDFSVVTLPGNEYHLKFKIASGAAALALQTTGYVVDVDFHAVMKVKDMLTTPNTGFYLMPQIRGQFVGKISPVYEELSCDDWGDNMTVLNVRTTNSTQFTGAGYANAGYNFPYSAGQCYRRFIIESVVAGGMTGLDEFPNEFRPIALWPGQNDPNQIQFTMPAGFHPITPFDPMAIFFAARESAPGWNWQQANYNLNGQTMTFTGYGTNNNPWPVLEHDGGKIQLTIAGTIRNDCPPINAPQPVAAYSLPNTRRAFALDEPACQDVNTHTQNVNVPLSDYTLLMNYGQNTIDITQLNGTISGLTVLYTDDIGNTPNVENFWIQNTSSGIVINSITICPAVQNPVCTTATAVNGYFQLGLLAENQQYNLSIDYTLTQCNTGTYFPLSMNYGFACNGYPPPGANSCGQASFAVNLNPLPAALSMSATNPPPVVSACSNIQYTFDLNSTLNGNVENMVFNATIPAGLTLVSAQYNLNGNIGNMTIYNQNGQIYSWALNANIPGGVSLAQSDNLTITITLTGTCASYGQTYGLYFEALGTDICSDPLTNTNNSTHSANLPFPSYNAQTNTCTDCFNCNNATLNQTNTGCNYTFTASVPNGSYCASHTISWAFGDGTFDNTNSMVVSHTYASSGVYQVCYTYNCYNANNVLIGTCNVCQPVSASCNSCAGAYMNVSISECSIEASAYAPNMTGCAYVMYAWGYGDGTFSGPYSFSNTTTHTYSAPGQYLLCYEAFCFDANWNLLYGCKECDTIDVDCGSDEFCMRIEKKFDPDRGNSITITKDDEYLVAGTMYEDGENGDNDMYIVKYKPDFSQEFYLKLGDYHGINYSEEGYSVVAVGDAYFVAGTVNLGGEDDDIFVVKLRSDGSYTWGFRYGDKPGSVERCSKMIDMDSPGIDALLLVGSILNSDGNFDALAIMIDPVTGAIMKQKAYYKTTKDDEIARDVVKSGVTSITDEYVIVGDHVYDGDYNILTMRINTSLDLLTPGVIYSVPFMEEHANAVTATDGTVYVTGSSRDPSPNTDIFLLELDGGNLSMYNNVHMSALSSSMDESANGIFMDRDGKLVITGETAEPGAPHLTDGLIIKLDPRDKFKFDWSGPRYTNIPDAIERFTEALQADADFYLVTGSYGTTTPNDEDVYLGKFKTDGTNCCTVDYPMYQQSMVYDVDEFEKSYEPKLKKNPHGEKKPYIKVEFICGSIDPVRLDNSSGGIASQLLVMPNPSTGVFTVFLKDESETIQKIKITDLTGRVLLSEKTTAPNMNSVVFDGSSLSTGMYVVEVSGSTRKWTTKISITR